MSNASHINGSTITLFEQPATPITRSHHSGNRQVQPRQLIAYETGPEGDFGPFLQTNAPRGGCRTKRRSKAEASRLVLWGRSGWTLSSW